MAEDRDEAVFAPHPEEMRASVDLTIGSSVSFRATARATPAGLVAAAILVSAVTISAIWAWKGRPGGWLESARRS